MTNHERLQLELRKFVAPEFVFGTDARLLVDNYCNQFGVQKVLLVTDKAIEKLPWYNNIRDKLNESSIPFEVFSSISPNPRDYEVMQGAERYKAARCNMIVAVGGGSVMDCAKGIGIVATNGKHISEFEGVDKIRRPMPPLVCIPTTAGTAADVSQFAIINNFSKKYKMAIISKATVPDIALIDPTVLTTMSPFLSACTGLDAFSHAFEAYVSNASSDITDLHALEAIRLIYHNLLSSIQNPDNMQLRGKIMLASLYAGLAFSNASLGSVHALAHSLGGYLDLPHGECNAMLLPFVVAFNFDASAEKYKTIATELGVTIDKMNNDEVKTQLVEKLVAFKNSVGITSTLKTKGVGNQELQILAKKAINDPCNATNPRLPSESDLKAIYKLAL
ncbi:MAG: alcohol dehydrogenase-like regulatory protein ErcA [Perlabentimonas sp.]